MAAKAGVMTNDHVHDLPARYSLILNAFRDVRLSKCPLCERPTHPRKFPLVIHVERSGTLILGKTCRYCARCELIIVHQDELEHELSICMNRIDPEAVGSGYFLLGTVDKKIWQLGLEGTAPRLADLRTHMVNFKKHLNLKVENCWKPV
jgi:hypothetical protein